MSEPTASNPIPFFIRVFTISALGIAALEIVSFLAFLNPWLSGAVFLAVVFGTVALALVRFEWAFLVLLAELFIGSQGGYLVAYGMESGLQLSLRIGLFLAVVGVWVAKLLAGVVSPRTSAARAATTATLQSLRSSPLLWPTLTLAGVLAMGSVRGVLAGYPRADVFFDANGYLYLALLPVFLTTLAVQRTRIATAAVLAAATFMTVAKALLTEFIFSHRMFDIASPWYTWVRDTRVGEITIQTGDFYRVFFQAHLFSLGVLFVAVIVLAYAASWRGRLARLLLALAVAIATAMLLSLSRSFWFGGAVAAGVVAAVLVHARASADIWKRLMGAAAIGVVGGIALILLTYSFPYPQKGSEVAFGELFGRRALSFTGESAATSRWVLLPQLMAAGWEHPVLGNGLGKSVTYVTSDPRLLADNPTGEYTTFAFEWGYHDVWVKFGVVGLAAYAWFLAAVLRPWVRTLRGAGEALRRPAANAVAALASPSVVALAVVGGMVALLATSVFSPYLNHPLGLGFLMLVAGWGVGEE